MKKIFLFFALIFLFLNIANWEYFNQWFKSFSESDNSINFVCEKQCITILWNLENNDKISISWKIDWKWILWYWFLIWEQIYPWENFQITWNTELNQDFNFSKLQFFSQIPKDSKIVLILDWALNWEKVSFDLLSIWWLEKLSFWLSDFWTYDTFKPYTINLLNWPKIFWESANSIFYWIFILWSIIILFISWFKIKKANKKIFILALVLFILYDIRMSLEMMSYYKNDYETYISKQKYEKVYRDRWDFYSFVDFVKDKLDKSWIKNFEKVSFYTDNNWPFPWSIIYFLYPYNVELNKETPKYYILYWYSKFMFEWSNLILDWKNIWIWKIIKFSDYAFIFIKN